MRSLNYRNCGKALAFVLAAAACFWCIASFADVVANNISFSPLWGKNMFVVAAHLFGILPV